jgi:hypothetical protein
VLVAQIIEIAAAIAANRTHVALSTLIASLSS